MRSLHARQWLVLVEALVLVPMVQASLCLRGFRRTADRLARWSQGPERTDAAVAPIELADAVAIVAGRRMIGARCLGRSLVTWFLLRRRGVDAECLIGAADPVAGQLKAHAWVEVGGVALNEDDDVIHHFGRFDLGLPRLSSPCER